MRSLHRRSRSLAAFALGAACLLPALAQAGDSSSSRRQDSAPTASERVRVQVFSGSSSTPMFDAELPLRDEGDSIARTTRSVPYIASVSQDERGRQRQRIDKTEDSARVSVAKTSTPGVYAISAKITSTELRSYQAPVFTAESSPEPYSDEAWRAANQIPPQPQEIGAIDASAQWTAEWLAQELGKASEELAEDASIPMRVDLPFVSENSSRFNARLKPGVPVSAPIQLESGDGRLVATLLKKS